MNIIGIVITASSIIATAAYFYNDNKQKNQKIYPYDDYPIIMEAANDYKIEKGEYCKVFKELAPYMEDFDKMPQKRYDLSLDGKFLTISGLSPEEGKKIINEIGGASHINGEIVYLTLMRKNDLSEVQPIAHFKMIPDRDITTTSAIKYDTSDCVAEDGEILEKKWENKQITFKEPGMYDIKLSIKDKNGNWSDPYVKEIKVTEETGIKDIDACSDSLFVLYRNGKVISKGENAYGELGLGNVNPVYDLTYHSMHDCVRQVVCGEHFCLYLLNDGSVFAAGQNQDGQLGTGDNEAHRTLNKVWGLENIK